MPPSKKKGGSSGPFGIIWQILCFPVTLARSIVFYPVDFTIYFLVDLLGDPKWFQGWAWKNSFVKQDRVKKTIAYCKEFRLALYDFGWPRVSSPVWRCKCCGKEGKVWCVDCKKKFCPQCAYNHHAPGMSAQIHSLEEFVDKQRQGVHLFTPIFAEALLVGFIFFAIYGSSAKPINENYLTAQLTCPMTAQARGFVAYYDNNVFYHFKQSFTKCCDLEDSFWRFIMDAWVRGVITETDNTILVFQTLPEALLFNVVLAFIIVPFLAVGYAFVFNMLYQLESLIPANDVTRKIESFLSWFNFLEYFGSGDYSKLPPETKKRRRPSMDPYEAFFYHKDRKLRLFWYYFEDTKVTLQRLIWTVLVQTMMFRLALLWFNLAGFVRWVVSSVGFAETVALHGKWFATAWSSTSNLLVTEDRIRQVGGGMVSVALDFINTAPSTVLPLLFVWAVLSLVFVLMFFWVCHYLLMKRRAWGGKFIGDTPKFERGTVSHALNFGQEKLLVKSELPKDLS